MCTVEGGIWFVQALCPILYYYSIKKKKIIAKQVLHIGEIYGTAFFSAIYVHGNSVYLIPNNAKKMVIYDILEKKCKYIDIEKSENNMYKQCYELEGRLFCVPYKAKQMFEVSINNHDDRKYINIYDSFDMGNINCINGTCRINNIVYCVVWKTNVIIEIDLTKRQAQKKAMPDNYSFCDINASNEKVYLYDINSKSIISYSVDLKTHLEDINIGWSEAIISTNDEGLLIIDSVDTSEIMIINSDGKKYIYNFEQEEYAICTPPWKINVWICDQKQNLWGIINNGYLVCVNNMGELRKTELVITSDEYREINNRLMREQSNCVFYENVGFQLEDFLYNVAKE